MGSFIFKTEEILMDAITGNHTRSSSSSSRRRGSDWLLQTLRGTRDYQFIEEQQRRSKRIFGYQKPTNSLFTGSSR